MRQRFGGWIAGLLVLCGAISWGSPAGAQGSGAAALRYGVVSVQVLDDKGAAVRTVNGTLLRAGVIVPISALAGGAKAVVTTTEGKSWTAENAIAANASIDLAMLQLPEAPEKFMTLPDDGSFIPGSKVTLLGAPGVSPDTLAASIFYTFQLRDQVDYIAISPGMKGAAPAVDANGRLLGVTGDISEPGFSLGFLIPAISIRVVSDGIGAPVSIPTLVGEGLAPWLERNSVPGLSFRGALLTTEGKFDDARTFLALALKKDTSSADAHYWMGRALFAGQQFEAAAEELQKAGEADPTFHMAYHMAGAAYHQAGKYGDAEKMYNKALDIKPNAPETYCNLGGTYFMEHQYDRAVQAFRKSISLDPRYQQGLAYSNLARTFKAMAQPAQAEEVYSDLLKINAAWAKRLRSELDGRQ